MAAQGMLFDARDSRPITKGSAAEVLEVAALGTAWTCLSEQIFHARLGDVDMLRNTKAVSLGDAVR